MPRCPSTLKSDRRSLCSCFSLRPHILSKTIPPELREVGSQMAGHVLKLPMRRECFVELGGEVDQKRVTVP